MARVVYVNGSYSPYGEAGVHVEDRGFQFADGVYEVCEVKAGHLIDERRHIDRLHRSLAELRMDAPMGRSALGVVMRETVRRNRVRNGLVYVQVTRGTAKRDFAFPAAGTAPTLVCFARSTLPRAAEKRAAIGLKVVTMPDIRWRRPDIKTISLLPQALARQAAYDAGAKEAWLVDDNGFVTEGASCNAWIITAENEIITRPAETGILRGITRTVVLDLLGKEGFQLIERPFSVAEAKAAAEAFNTSASGIMPVIEIDGVPVGKGRPGPIVLRIRQHFHNFAETSPIRALLS
jgi:D-alanine transaminase